MFDSLTDRLQEVFANLRRRGKLRPEDVDRTLREIRLALLEADVHYQVVQNLLDRVRERALGAEVLDSLNPSQQVIKILHEELENSLGDPGELALKGSPPKTIMLVGLQGSGKTTTAAKLAKHLRKSGDRVWIVAADPYRPAAVDQLMQLAGEIGVDCYFEPELSPPQLARQGIKAARQDGATVVVMDTAGRSQLDQDMMAELREIEGAANPAEILLVADAMTGQQAVNIAQGFQDYLSLTGIILTKMDGDARGGAAISMRSVAGVPIKFIGTGEGREALERFLPDRLASRIMGMGDVMSLIERAEQQLDVESAEKQVARLQRGEFNFEDMAAQIQQVRQLGPLGKLMEMLPAGLTGGRSLQLEGTDAEAQLNRTLAIIQSMTPEERRNPSLLNASRKRRVAAGSGTTVQEINQLIRQQRQMKRVMKKLGKGGLGNLRFG